MIPNCTKKELRDFIEKKVKGLREDIRKQIVQTIALHTDKILEDILQPLKEFETLAGQMNILYDKMLDNVGLMYPWTWSQNQGIKSELNSFEHQYGNILESLKSKIYKTVVGGQTIQMYPLPLCEPIIRLQKDLASKIRRYKEELPQLARDLENVIKVARSGKDAYKSLVVLGVDMKDFESSAPGAYLPAVVKLSVDVCIINGEC